MMPSPRFARPRQRYRLWRWVGAVAAAVVFALALAANVWGTSLLADRCACFRLRPEPAFWTDAVPECAGAPAGVCPPCCLCNRDPSAGSFDLCGPEDLRRFRGRGGRRAAVALLAVGGTLAAIVYCGACCGISAVESFTPLTPTSAWLIRCLYPPPRRTPERYRTVVKKVSAAARNATLGVFGTILALSLIRVAGARIDSDFLLLWYAWGSAVIGGGALVALRCVLPTPAVGNLV